MVVPLVIILVGVCVLLLYRHLESRRSARAMWRSTVVIGCGIGVVRGVLACVGWYTVEHTGGPLQIPGYLLAMLAWPEAALLDTQRGPTPMTFFPALVLLLLVTTMTMAVGIGFVVQLRRGWGSPH